jgi:flagellar motor switch/type III secretory pathway protein FliN
MVRAIDEMSAETTTDNPVGGGAAGEGPAGAEATPHSQALEEVLGGISLRVWVELGRAGMPLGSALGLPVGAVLDLDRSADAPVDLYVNGVRFGRGQLLVTEEGEWAVSLETLESEGLRLIDRARSGASEARADVESPSQPLDSSSDQPIETQTSPTDTDPESQGPEAPETPEQKQPHVEGAVT